MLLGKRLNVLVCSPLENCLVDSLSQCTHNTLALHTVWICCGWERHLMPSLQWLGDFLHAGLQDFCVVPVHSSLCNLPWVHCRCTWVFPRVAKLLLHFLQGHDGKGWHVIFLGDGFNADSIFKGCWRRLPTLYKCLAFDWGQRFRLGKRCVYLQDKSHTKKLGTYASSQRVDWCIKNSAENKRWLFLKTYTARGVLAIICMTLLCPMHLEATSTQHWQNICIQQVNERSLLKITCLYANLVVCCVVELWFVVDCDIIANIDVLVTIYIPRPTIVNLRGDICFCEKVNSARYLCNMYHTKHQFHEQHCFSGLHTCLTLVHIASLLRPPITWYIINSDCLHWSKESPGTGTLKGFSCLNRTS